MTLLAASLSHVAVAQSAAPLIFERPAAQGPGTPGFGIVSDPTIRPFQAPGVPAQIGKVLPIDFQGNGRPDLLVCHSANPPVPATKQPCRVLRPQSDGSVAEITRQTFGAGALPSRESPSQIVAGDFNGDGRPDIFIAAFGYDAPPFNGETNVLLISNADGTYSDRSLILPQVSDNSHSACVGDINGDGQLDIYVGNTSGRPGIGPYFLVGNGDGTFTQKTSGLPEQIQSLQEKFLSCLFVDVDQDGYPDLVLGTHADHGYVDSIILFNDGTGDFTRRPRYVLPPGPLGATNSLVLGIVAFDINRDRRPDLVLLSTTISTGGTALQVLINRGDGTFGDESAARLGPSAARFGGSYCGGLRPADLNGDGWPDFYCVDGPQDVPNRYWLSNGNGTWTPDAVNALPQGSGFGTHAVDFDGDGRPDLLPLAHTQTGDVAYMSFLNRTPRTVPSEPIIGRAIAGNGLASIFFTPPLGSGASPITGYTATCSPGTFTGVVTGTGTGSPITVTGLTNGRSYACSVTATSAAGTSLPSGTATVRAAACGNDPRALCVNGERFAVTARWTAGQQSGDGMPVPLTADTGYFWFFSSNNVEMVVKVVDGRAFNSRVWVFAGGLTNVSVEMTVTDTQTDAVTVYTNPQSTAFQPIQDTSAFVCP